MMLIPMREMNLFASLRSLFAKVGENKVDRVGIGPVAQVGAESCQVVGERKVRHGQYLCPSSVFFKNKKRFLCNYYGNVGFCTTGVDGYSSI